MARDIFFSICFSIFLADQLQVASRVWRYGASMRSIPAGGTAVALVLGNTSVLPQLHSISLCTFRHVMQ